jgi:hypothetical protein
MKTLHYLILSILFLSSCDKFDWHNPYDPECPKELFTPSSPGAAMEGNSVKLTWSQQNDDISGFALFRSAEGGSITNLTQTQKSTTQYLDANITPGKKYTYYVVAVAGTNKSDTVKAEITPVIPITISTGSVTELTATSAKVSGNITNAGGGTVTSRGICWSTTPNPTVNNSKTTEGTGAGQFTSTLTNLLAATTYYARAYGENSRGISYGSEISFTTLGPPKLTTTAVSNITATTATSGGTIISDGGSPITAKGVVWSTTPNPTIDLATKTNDGTGVGSFTSGLSNLINNTKYYIRSYATNIIGTSYGEEFIFTALNPIEEKLKQGIVAYYPFNSNANDESGNANHGTVNGAVLTSDRLNVTSKAYFFNGSNSYIDIANTFFDNGAINYSISLWFNPEAYNANTFGGLTFVNTQPHNGMGFGFSYNGGQKIYLFKNSDPMTLSWNIFSNSTVNYTQINLNTWYHVVLVKTGLTYSYYVNGQIINSVNTTVNTLPFQCSIRIGAISLGKTFETFNGKLDEVRFYNRALTQEEITYLANN